LLVIGLGILLLNGSLRVPGFLSFRGSLFGLGILLLNGSLVSPGFLYVNGSFLVSGFLSPCGMVLYQVKVTLLLKAFLAGSGLGESAYPLTFMEKEDGHGTIML